MIWAKFQAHSSVFGVDLARKRVLEKVPYWTLAQKRL